MRLPDPDLARPSISFASCVRGLALSFVHELLLGPGAYLLYAGAGTADSGGSASYDIQLTVPEPGTGLQLALALITWLAGARKRRSRSAPSGRVRLADAHQR
jgi:hypothetical protein